MGFEIGCSVNALVILALLGILSIHEIHAACGVVNDATTCEIGKWFSKLGIFRKEVRFYR